jgi:hypothetical protein
LATFANTAQGLALEALPASGYITNINDAGPLSNVRLAQGTHTLTASRTINSLVLEEGAILVGNGFVLMH